MQLQGWENTCSLFMVRKSLRSSVRGSRWLSSRMRFSARCSSSRAFWAMKEVSDRVLILFLSNTSSLSWWSPSSPSTWLISLPRHQKTLLRQWKHGYKAEFYRSQKNKSYVHTQNNIKRQCFGGSINIFPVYCMLFALCCERDWNYWDSFERFCSKKEAKDK